MEPIVLRVATRKFWLERLGKQFPTEEAREKYLKEHPDADASKHTVKKDKGEKPKADMSDVHPTDENYDAIKKLREKKLRDQAKEKRAAQNILSRFKGEAAPPGHEE